MQYPRVSAILRQYAPQPWKTRWAVIFVSRPNRKAVFNVKSILAKFATSARTGRRVNRGRRKEDLFLDNTISNNRAPQTMGGFAYWMKPNKAVYCYEWRWYENLRMIIITTLRVTTTVCATLTSGRLRDHSSSCGWRESFSFRFDQSRLVREWGTTTRI